MKVLLPAVVLAGMLLPAAALSTTLRAAPAPATPAADAPAPLLAGVAARGSYPANLLVVSATGGLLLSRDGGRTWARPRGPLPAGGFYAVVADPKEYGAAYASNGDIYRTTDGGQDWQPLSAPAGAAEPGGITALTCGADGTLYAAGAAIFSYRPGRGWGAWGRDWPADTPATALLAAPGRGLYAAAGNRLYRLAGQAARWALVRAWSGPIEAMAMGPDGATPYVAVRGQGIWRVDPGTPNPIPHHLGGDGLPDATPVYALQGDPVGDDLYAATADGLVRRHRPADPTDTAWDTNLIADHGPLVALQPSRRGQGMLALARDGSLYEGLRRGGQSLSWGNPAPYPVRATPPLVAALSGAAWQPLPLPPRLPAQFTAAGSCARFGTGAERDFDVCGPFKDFYIAYGGHTLFDYPSGFADSTGNGGVVQRFDKVWLAWDRARGAHLAPLGRGLARRAGHRGFRHPSRAQVQQIVASGLGRYLPNTGYYVDPLFYPFWRTYLDPTGLSIFGYPISQAFYEQSSDGTGRAVRVQYFTNVRLEDDGGTIAVSYLKGMPVRRPGEVLWRPGV